MKAKALPMLMGIFLLVSTLATPAPALAWTITPQKVRNASK
jgi:hypothetical protein